MSVASPMRTDEWLGRYRIIRKIGQGGMGEVYLAEDPKLDRQIALKVLNSDFSSDSDRMKRFVHEAKTASALNHPNIITIYEIDDENEIPFIAMEFVEGETLGRRMKAEPLSPLDSLEVAIQVASALSAAHEASVVHRDIKPDNVIIRPDGIVKVLDFGLAKQLPNGSVPDSGDELPHVVNTTPGMVLGTVAYMSPEQARGKLVDARSDIFSFGSMFYQMVSGKLPFTGENDVDTVGSILHKNPRPLSQSARYIPHDVEVVIKKTLRKNRDERYQSTRELLADLRDIRAAMSLELMSDGSGNLSDYERALPTERISLANFAGRTDPISRAPSTLSGALIGEFRDHPLKSFGVSLLVAGILALGAFGIFRVVESFRKPESFQTMRFSKLTYSGNVAGDQAAISPDGKYIAYATQEPGQQGLWVKQVAADTNAPVVVESQQRFTGITFTPDSNYVYYTALEKEGLPSLYQVAVLGGPARKLIADAKGPITFSPDGKSIAFIRGETSLMLANADGSNQRLLATGENGGGWLRLAWSPDGRVIAASHYSVADDTDRLVEVSASNGSQRQISSEPWYTLRGIAWLKDGSGLLAVGRDPETQLSQIWKIDFPDGKRHRVTNDLNSYQGMSLSGDGLNVVSTLQNIFSDVWTAEPEDSTKVRKLTVDSGKGNGISGVSWAPNGQVVYTTGIREIQDIWIANQDGTESRQLTVNAKSNFSPSVSLDGRHIVFVSTRMGNPDIWKMDLDGGNPSPLIATPNRESDPTFSKDGKWIVFQSTDRNDLATIWKISVDGGDAVQLTKTESRRPVVSPDNRFVAYYMTNSKSDPVVKLGIISMEGGELVKAFDQTPLAKSRTVRWSADGKSLIYIDGQNQVDNLWSQPLENGPPKQLTDFKSDRIFRFDISPVDGRIIVSRGNDASDAVMISNFS